MEDVIKDFFHASIIGDMENFDFENAFSMVENAIGQKLIEHGQMSYEEFLDNEESIFGKNTDNLTDYTIFTNYLVISPDEIYDCIMRYKYQKVRDTFKDMYTFMELKRLYMAIENHEQLSITEKVLLFDECIHAQHETGEIFEDIDIEAIKDEIDSLYK